MNLLLFSERDRLGGDRIRLRDHRLRHLREVIRASAGDCLRVGEIGGLMGLGEVLKLGRAEAILEVRLSERPPAKLPLQLILALPRPKMLRRILRAAAELGVAELHLLHCARVEKSYWQTPALEPVAVEEHFLQGLMQARDTVPPTLRIHRRFRPFVEDLLPALAATRLRLVAHPGPHAPCPAAIERPATLAVGPEGGFVAFEVEKLREAGFSPVSLGPRILRVENAVTTLAARMRQDLGPNWQPARQGGGHLTFF